MIDKLVKLGVLAAIALWVVIVVFGSVILQLAAISASLCLGGIYFLIRYARKEKPIGLDDHRSKVGEELDRILGKKS